MRRNVVIIVLLWLTLTAAGEALVVLWDPMRQGAAEEAAIVDKAFRILMVMGVPVFTFVVAILAYSLFRFRNRGEPSQDGPPLRAHRPLLLAWFGVTIALTVLMILYPGVTGMGELRTLAQREPDLIVKAEGMRFAWRLTYPQQSITTWKELVLPVDKHVRFEVTSTDVIHSFWVPAFRMKIDALPGVVTFTHATPDKVGNFDDEFSFRLQCAELCGLGHAVMTVPVRVVEQAEFEAWVARQTKLTKAH